VVAGRDALILRPVMMPPGPGGVADGDRAVSEGKVGGTADVD
jgi:hypothetical protein